MANRFSLNRDINGAYSQGLPAPSVNYNATLTTGGGATNFTVPSSSSVWIARFGYEESASVLVAINVTAAIPAGATLAASASMVRPAELLVKAADTISMVSADATADVSVSLYPL